MTEENKNTICELISMMVISVEDETTINIDLTDIKEDYISFKKEGIFTVTFIHELNPTVKKSYKIKV